MKTCSVKEKKNDEKDNKRKYIKKVELILNIRK